MEASAGKRLQAARKNAGFRTQQSLGDALGVSDRTIRAWEADQYPVPLEYRENLARLLHGFTFEGDAVEMAVRSSRLTEDRQYVVLGTYKRQLREQDAEEAEGRGA